ncbi:hypothetical protein [Gordonia sp. (in: high G+C Gram-positive bacteria)]|uniref:hypothetical protein n=1 Tax=unclassified Gordonia (in: high G+C Gram-positive bacteria) TaxID=2657482 RepID=UPI0026348465|nr:hypothetical protein [Gordonia sp. (in: high G+C Gram-positive bacteria)]
MSQPYGPPPRDPFQPIIPGPPAGPPYGAPPPGGPLEPPLVTIGDIVVTRSHVITPSGTFALKGARWNVVNYTQTTQTTSQTGLILAIVGAVLICALSLLFLLMKEDKTTGYVQVIVAGANGVQHVCNIPAYSPAVLPDISSRVSYAQSLSL